ncbi:hypothetical protein AGMMS49545_08290 [Betaproteobacteria bacterium]|nr:hypothetical protein AGMMS49545_08290 [Betaproteobacteria bacterium]GHU40426.1 hypothetical protein AGMMS50289_01950 [Betaproteobacteria bacterium]
MKLITLYTAPNGCARFREESIDLPEGTPAARLSRRFPATGFQLRHSPVGFKSEFHCTTSPQLTIILSGQMEIGLRDGSARVFSAGEFFYSNDLVPAGETFNPELHGHCSRQLGDEPLETLFLKV